MEQIIKTAMKSDYENCGSDVIVGQDNFFEHIKQVEASGVVSFKISFKYIQTIYPWQKHEHLCCISSKDILAMGNNKTKTKTNNQANPEVYKTIIDIDQFPSFLIQILEDAKEKMSLTYIEIVCFLPKAQCFTEHYIVNYRDDMDIFCRVPYEFKFE